jgi:hypothetical protein
VIKILKQTNRNCGNEQSVNEIKIPWKAPPIGQPRWRKEYQALKTG